MRAAGILFTDGKAILLLKKSKDPNKWGLPGGKAKENETAITNAIRETKEETGLKRIPGKRVDTLVDMSDQFTTFFYKVEEQFEEISLSKEHSDWKWAEIDKMKSMELHPKLRENLPRYLKIIKRKVRNFKEWHEIHQIVKQFPEL